MRKIILYSASSLDFFIARKNGEVDWLFVEGDDEGEDYGYAEFFSSIDTTLMGNKTYQQVLGFGDFPYSEKENYVFTKNKELQKDENVNFVSEKPIDFIRDLKNMKEKDIWLIGGGKINQILLENNLIDEIILSVHPIILGDGIALFDNSLKEIPIKLIQTKNYKSGLVKLHYQIKKV